MTPISLRRRLLGSLCTLALLAACAGTPPASEYPPIVFVHGNGDTAALWHTTIWRFESNGWPRERLHAIDLPYPLARDADDKAQPGRTSSAEHMQFLASEVDQVLRRTGAARVVLTIRSDNNDKFAQPDGVWIGAKGTATNVNADGPELKGALNVVIPGIDHRETSYGARAFAATHEFLTGRQPRHDAAQPESPVVLDGKVSGLGLDNREGGFVNNLPLAGATLEVYATDATTGARLGDPLHRATIGADGRWGPLTTTSKTALEFVLNAPGYATTHICRSPFTRSSSWVHLRVERVATADRDVAAVVTLTRPRGYFGLPRDDIELDGQRPPAGIPSGVAGVSVARARLADATPRSVVGVFNRERIVGRSWPTSGNHVVLLELHD